MVRGVARAPGPSCEGAERAAGARAWRSGGMSRARHLGGTPAEHVDGRGSDGPAMCAACAAALFACRRASDASASRVRTTVDTALRILCG